MTVHRKIAQPPCEKGARSHEAGQHHVSGSSKDGEPPH